MFRPGPIGSAVFAVRFRGFFMALYRGKNFIPNMDKLSLDLDKYPKVPASQYPKAVQEALQAAEKESAPAAPVASATSTGNTPVAPGMMRIEIVSQQHSDGKAKKTWLRGSVIEIDEYTAQRMINNLKCAFPTTAPVNEILVEYQGK